MYIYRRYAAFSLVELSIVLVILGLLVGGLLAGKSLIHAAGLRHDMRTLERYKVAFFTFKDKYFYLPGDMPNATAFWGDDPIACADSTVSDGEACNGNGDGTIGNNSSVANSWGESIGAWEDLRLAGLIEGTYYGRRAPTLPYLAIGQNIPAMSNPQIGINAMGWTSITGRTGGVYQRGEGNFFQVGSVQSGNVNSNYLWGNSYTPEDAWNMDTKMDDGLPGSGQLMSVDANTGTAGVGLYCTSDHSVGSLDLPPANFTYLLSGSNLGCLVYYRIN